LIEAEIASMQAFESVDVFIRNSEMNDLVIFQDFAEQTNSLLFGMPIHGWQHQYVPAPLTWTSRMISKSFQARCNSLRITVASHCRLDIYLFGILLYHVLHILLLEMQAGESVPKKRVQVNFED
jgi:hypothetical protein